VVEVPSPSAGETVAAARGGGLGGWRTRVDGWLGTRWALALVLGLAAWAYAAAYSRHPLRPTVDPAVERTGWWTWHDQYTYWKSANELAAGAVTRENYVYPLGYAALGAPWRRLLPKDPFVLANLALVLLTVGLAWQLAGRWLGRLPALVALGWFGWSQAELLALTQVIPWNTIATQAALWTGIWLLLTRPGPRVTWGLGVLAALAYLVRPVDAACLGPLLVWSVLRLASWRERILAAAGGAAALAVAVVGVGLLNRAVFGSWGTPYEYTSWNAVGFLSYPVAHKLFWIFVDGRPFFGEEGVGLIGRMPWLLLVPAGLVYWVRREGGAAVAAAAAVGLNWAFYVAYNDFVPSGVFRFSLIHYVSWSLPLLFLLAAAAVWRGWRDRGVRAAGALGAVAAVAWLGLRLEEQPVAAAVAPGRVERLPEARPVWVRFPGVPVEEVTRIEVAGRRPHEGRDYHIPYVPTDLKVLFGSPAQGEVRLRPGGVGDAVVPEVGTLAWGWRWSWERLAGKDRG